jgi:hypothetical protein
MKGIAAIARGSVLVLCIALSGCFGTERTRMNANVEFDRLDKGGATPLAMIAYTPLEPGRRIKYDHDASMAIIDANGGHAFARGFALPPKGSFQYLALRSNIIGRTGNIAVPRLMLLDAAFEPIATVENARFAYRQSWTENDGLVTRLAIPERFDSARYVVLYTSPASFRGSMTRACKWSAGITMIGQTPVSTGGEGCINVYVSPVGLLSIEAVN